MEVSTKQRNALAALFAQLRNEGRELPAELLDLHEGLCAWQTRHDEERRKREAEIAELERLYELPAEEVPGVYELHLSPAGSFTAARRRRVKACGGKHSECRGHSDKRFVTLPNTETGRTVLAELLGGIICHAIICRPERSRNTGHVDRVRLPPNLTVLACLHSMKVAYRSGIAANIEEQRRYFARFLEQETVPD